MTTTQTPKPPLRRLIANKYSWGAMGFLWLFLALNANGRMWATGVLQPAIVNDFELDPSTAGWIGGLFVVATGVLATPLGAWLDRGGHGWRRKYRYVVIAVLYTVFTLLSGFTVLTATLLMFILLQVCNKAFAGAGEAAEVTSVTEWWSVERRGFATGLHHTAVPWGTFLGSLAVAAVFSLFGEENWRYALFIPVIIMVPVLFFWWRFSSQPRYAKFERAVIDAGETPPLQAQSQEAKEGVRPGALKRAFKNPNLIVVSLVTGLCVAIYAGVSSWIPLYLAFVANYSLAQTAAVSFIFMLTGGLGQIVWGAVSDRIGRKPTLVITFAWVALGLVLLQFMGVNFALLIVLQLFLGCAINGVYAVLYAMTSDSTEPGALGIGLGMNMTGQILGAIGPILVGVLIAAGGGYGSTTGFIWTLYTMAGLMVIGIVVILLFTRETVGKFKRYDRALVPIERCIPDMSIRTRGIPVVDDEHSPTSTDRE